MEDYSRHRYFKRKEFKPGQLASAVRAVLTSVGVSESDAGIKGRFDFGEGGNAQKTLTLSDLEPICDFWSGHPSSVTVTLKTSGEGWHYHYVGLSRMADDFHLWLSSPDAACLTKISDVLTRELALDEVALMPEPPGLAELETRVEALENNVLKTDAALSCFLSYRFNSRSKVYALELTRFLALVGVDVVTGLGYEPRRVSEKVLERLKEGNLSFFIYLITREGESTWTRDELAIARGSDIPLVLLVEKGGEIGKGLLADWEYAEFEGDHIGDTFIPILEAIRFVRRNRQEAPLAPAVMKAAL